MTKRNSKSQGPSSKQTPNPKPRADDAAAPGVSYWISARAGEESLELKDNPIGAPVGERPPFDLEERTARFGEAIVRFSKSIPRSPANDRLIDQLVGAATSVGANYCEANEGVSKKDFRHSIDRCKKEIKEAKFFLRMIAASEPQLADKARLALSRGNRTATYPRRDV